MTYEDELTCIELVQLITNYLEGALSPDDQARFEAHLAGCENCTHYVEQMRKTLTALNHLPVESIEPAVQAELLAIFRTWKSA